MLGEFQILSINCYLWLAPNKNRLDLYKFPLFSRVVLIKITKKVRNLAGVKVVTPKNIFLETARL